MLQLVQIQPSAYILNIHMETQIEPWTIIYSSPQLTCIKFFLQVNYRNLRDYFKTQIKTIKGRTKFLSSKTFAKNIKKVCDFLIRQKLFFFPSKTFSKSILPRDLFHQKQDFMVAGIGMWLSNIILSRSKGIGKH